MATILIVDDSATDRKLASLLIERSLDCTLLQADCAEAALEQLEQVEPDLVLTDLQMPGLTGLDLVGRMRDDWPNVPVILMTARGSEEIAAEALKAGAASYVPKSRLASSLIPTVQRILVGSQQERTHSRLMHHLAEGELKFVLHNDVSLISPLVRTAQEMLRSLPLGEESERLRVGVALEEAIQNAILHGNLEIGSSEQEGRSPGEVASERMWTAPYYERRVFVTVKISREEAVFTVRNEGPGFDASLFENNEFNADDPRGRGIRLMRTFMDDVRFEDSGRTVILSRKRVDEATDDDESAD
jgi:CheY-like chemotaxis protein/anti-sigma regulatory factor (Ser/Thr protein kinase)